MDKHESHEGIIKRLKRARGHLNKVISMIEEPKPCTPVAQQLQAVVKALESAKRAFIEDHIDNCISNEALRQDADVINDMREIAKYL